MSKARRSKPSRGVKCVRMRKKKNLVPRLHAVDSQFVHQPETLRGRWHKDCRGAREAVWVELGCGMGQFAAATALRYPEQLMVAVEKVPEAIVVAAEKAKSIDNIVFVSQDAASLETWFADGEIDRLYIQFCDPWHKSKQKSKRLTYRAFLKQYAAVLAQEGVLVFKTDNVPLFEFTKEELVACEWDMLEVSENWHKDVRWTADDIQTEYEQKFAQQSMPICRILAKPPRPAKDQANILLI